MIDNHEYVDMYKAAWNAAARVREEKTIFHWTVKDKPSQSSIANMIFYDLLYRARLADTRAVMLVESPRVEEGEELKK